MEEWLLLLSVSLSLWDFTYNQITTFPLKLNPLFRLLWKITGVSAGICTEQIPRCDFGEIGVKSNLNLASAHQFIWSLMDLDTPAYKFWSYFFGFHVLPFWMWTQSCCFAMSTPPAKPQHDWKHSVKASPFHFISLALYSHL